MIHKFLTENVCNSRHALDDDHADEIERKREQHVRQHHPQREIPPSFEERRDFTLQLRQRLQPRP